MTCLSAPDLLPFPCHFFICFLLLIFSSQIAETRIVGKANSTTTSSTSSIPALFVFGDSTADAGNNNYIKTAARSNFPPYGKDFPNHIATGRFTNGKLVTDYVASYAGIKEPIPAYLDPTLTLDRLRKGACFASASTGFDPLTALQTSVISMESQLQYFREYKSRMEGYIGKAETKRLIGRGVFVISAGTNDFVLNYYGPTLIRRKEYSSVSGYQQFILQLGRNVVLSLVEMGARNILFVGLPPMGCLPAVITLYSDNALAHRGCIESLSSVARDYNRLLQAQLTALQVQTHARVFYVDIFNPLNDMIRNPLRFGFENVYCGCCGSGLLETSFLCNPLSVVCADDSKYVFWDSIHPTQAVYYKIFQTVRPIIDILLKD